MGSARLATQYSICIRKFLHQRAGSYVGVFKFKTYTINLQLYSYSETFHGAVFFLTRTT